MGEANRMALNEADSPWRKSLVTYLMLTSLMLVLLVIYFYYYIGKITDFLVLVAFLTPAMVANGSAVLARKVKLSVKGESASLTPIDGGRTWKGKPILGSNKTWEGLFFGSLLGVLAGEIIAVLAWFTLDWELAPMLAVVTPYVSVAALLGDLASSFWKRRRGLRPGEPFPICDQLDFYLFAVIALLLTGFRPPLMDIVLVGLFVYSLHIVTNCIAREIGIKKECP